MNARMIKLALGFSLCAVLGMQPVDAASTLPFAGTANGAVTSFVPGPGGIAITVSAQGNATQLGLLTREEHLLLDPVTMTFSGTIEFTAANGDRLSGVLEGGFVSPTSASGTYFFDGGTGRFANTTGSAEFVLNTPDGVNFRARFEGSLDKK